MSKSFIDEQIEVLAETEGVDIKDAAQEWVKRSEHAIELDKLQPQVHRWVDRGAVMSCEHAGHPPHRSFKIRG